LREQNLGFRKINFANSPFYKLNEAQNCQKKKNTPFPSFRFAMRALLFPVVVIWLKGDKQLRERKLNIGQ